MLYDVGQTLSGTNAARLIGGGSVVSGYSQALVCCQSVCVLWSSSAEVDLSYPTDIHTCI